MCFIFKNNICIYIIFCLKKINSIKILNKNIYIKFILLLNEFVFLNKSRSDSFGVSGEHTSISNIGQLTI